MPAIDDFTLPRTPNIEAGRALASVLPDLEREPLNWRSQTLSESLSRTSSNLSVGRRAQTRDAGRTEPRSSRTKVGDAQGRVIAAYTAMHGHPLEHDGKLDSAHRTYRWKYSLRATAALLVFVLIVGCVALVVSTWNKGSVVRELEGQSSFGSVTTSDSAAVSPDLPLEEGYDAEVAADAGATLGSGLADADNFSGNLASASASGAGAALSRSGQPANSATVFVHVAGAVRKPGLYELEQAARVHDALVAAGDATSKADLDRLNLAQVLQDGQQIFVPAKGEAVTLSNSSLAGAAVGSQTGGATALINVNLASIEQLDELPGVGPAIAQRIIEFRTENGPFTRLDDLQSVSGIGPALLEKIQPLATTGS